MLCLHCQTETKNKKFCSRSCSNIGIRRHGEARSVCKECGNLCSSCRQIYCSNKCQRLHEHKTQMIPKILEGKISNNTPLKTYLIEIFGYKCILCGISTWQNQKLTLQLDHIDGNSDNNFPNNLRLLCPNCHSQTPTYKGGNKNRLKQTKRNIMHRKIYAEKSVEEVGFEPTK